MLLMILNLFSHQHQELFDNLIVLDVIEPMIKLKTLTVA